MWKTLELQYKDNVIFGVTVILMFLDPLYDQAEISASKVQERMTQRNSNPIQIDLVICERGLDWTSTQSNPIKFCERTRCYAKKLLAAVEKII